VCGLLAKALGPTKVICVYTGINSSQESLDRARLVTKTFGVRLAVMDLSDLFKTLTDRMLSAYLQAHDDGGVSVGLTKEVLARIDNDPTVLGSIRSCIRAPIGRGFNRLHGGGIRHGTGNECEDRWLRFYQKGGDGEVDCNALAMLSKGEVYQLGVALGVPREIIDALPTPDLWGKGEEHNDEAELLTWAGAPFTYSRVDPKTGEYTKVGTIERVSRFADDWPGLFHVANMDLLVHESGEHPAMAPLPPQLRKDLLVAARRVERMTRHKWNPNCPSLGGRDELVAAEILSNQLPDQESGEETSR
jgi:NH3-dependent NAD+ synthetase